MRALKKNKLWWLAFFLIVLLTIFLRFFRLGVVPIELNRDEAALGYTAYSLLESGHDEHGVSWPISFESFGDWKLPGYIYSLIPIVQVFGLSNWSVRLLSAVAGVTIVVGGMVLVWQLADGEKVNRRLWLALLTGLFLAISPWNIHMSHMAYEANLANALMLWGVVGLVTWVKKQQSKWSVAGAILIGLSMITYHAFQLVVPLLVVSFGFIFSEQIKQIWKKQKANLFAVVIIFCLPMTIFLLRGGYGNNQTKLSGLSIFDPGSYQLQIDEERAFFYKLPFPSYQIYSSPIVKIADQLQRNVAAAVSANFLLFEGGGHGSHDIKGTGKIYPIQWLFVLISSVIFWQYLSRKKSIYQSNFSILYIWLLIGFLPAIITFQAAHAVRSVASLLPLSALAAIGLVATYEWLAKRTWLARIFLALVGWFLFFGLFQFSVTYFFIYPLRDAHNWDWQINSGFWYVDQHQSDYDHVLVANPQSSPYIYFLFKKPYSPDLLSQDLSFYEVDSEGFHYASRLGKIEFPYEFDWHKYEETGEKYLFLLEDKQVPQEVYDNSRYQILETLNHPFVQTKWLLIGLK